MTDPSGTAVDYSVAVDYPPTMDYFANGRSSPGDRSNESAGSVIPILAQVAMKAVLRVVRQGFHATLQFGRVIGMRRYAWAHD